MDRGESGVWMVPRGSGNLPAMPLCWTRVSSHPSDPCNPWSFPAFRGFLSCRSCYVWLNPGAGLQGNRIR